MSDVALILCSSHLTAHLWNGWHPEQKGNRYPFATIGCYQAADAPLMISASNLRQQRRLWEALGRHDLIKENNRERIRAHAAESAALKDIITTMPVEHWERVLQAARVPASRVQRLEAMLADDHVRSRKVLHRFDARAGALEGLTVPVAGFRLSACDVGVSALPQAAGAQNEQVLKSLGYRDDDIENLRVGGVI
jgi:crotonobetainyl-CoA:carnitine CoA-transferase CaiB-like acyl-CoA transferase